jgi:hypothetical protein
VRIPRRPEAGAMERGAGMPVSVTISDHPSG